MIFLIHKNAREIFGVFQDDVPLEIKSTTCSAALWELSERFPEELICWCEKEFRNNLNLNAWENVFHHNLIMASYAIKNNYLPDSIGYIDQLPFVNVNLNVEYATWQMSADVGGIKARTLLQFKSLFLELDELGYLINSVAKIGQQNGLFCYSAPALVKDEVKSVPTPIASKTKLFQFVYQHYNTPWTGILLFCLYHYEGEFDFFSFLKSFFHRKFFKEIVDLSEIPVESKRENKLTNSIDVIIPTMGRPEHLLNVVEDLSKQTLLPKNVIVVEQNPDENSTTDLSILKSEKWPFNIIHHFIHQTGACNARNIALKETKSDWVFFCDDDNRFESNLLKNAIIELKKYGASCINTAYLQPNEKLLYEKVKQWGTFGAGNAFVKKEALKDLFFSSVFEHGYGEDIDFGMQLRKNGCDILYHPNLEIVHLKAPMGGFREKPAYAWAREIPFPKPSPTVMAFAIKYYSLQQLRGFKVSLFLKFYKDQEIKNPAKYVKVMKRKWNKSKEWAEKLIAENETSGFDLKRTESVGNRINKD